MELTRMIGFNLMNKTYQNIWTIGDIHGDHLACQYLLREIDADPENDLIVFLGDYIDRGLDTAGLLDTLIALKQSHQCIFLKGNHEQTLLRAKSCTGELDIWLNIYSGQATLDSYEGGTISDIPDAHWHFMENTCKSYHENDDHIFVHGGVLPDLPISEQSIQTLYWQRIEQAEPHQSGKRVICGHSGLRQEKPENLGHTVCIDVKPWLTALNVKTNIYIQANDHGVIQRGQL